ncbi:MAG: tetratricopeptide repeat protein [Candidatus Brocadiia bacterium]
MLMPGWWMKVLFLGILFVFVVQAAEQNPDENDLEARYDELHRMVQQNKHRQALSGLERFLNENPDWPRRREAELLYAIELVENGKLAPAQERLGRFIAVAPDSAAAVRARFHRGRAEEGLGNFEQAMLTYESVHRGDKDLPLARKALLKEFQIAAKIVRNYSRAHDGAQRFFESYPEDPRGPDLYNQLGILAEMFPGDVDPGFMQDWYVVGPFSVAEHAENAYQSGFDRAFPPEKGVDLDAKYQVSDTQKAGWRRVPADARAEDGLINLQGLFAPNSYAVAYAWTSVVSQKQKRAWLIFGSDDGFKIWINGKEVSGKEVYRPAQPAQDVMPVVLKKGENDILLKITQAEGEWGFYCRLTHDYPRGPAAAIHYYKQYAEKYPDDDGNGRMNGRVAGADRALWQAAQISRSQLQDPASAALLYAKWENLPHTPPGEGYIEAARLLSGASYAGDAGPYFNKALKAEYREDWHLDYAQWLKKSQPENPRPAVREFAELTTRAVRKRIFETALKELTKTKLLELVQKDPFNYQLLSHYLGRPGKADFEQKHELLPGEERSRKIGWAVRVWREWFEKTERWQDACGWRRRAVEKGDVVGIAQSTLAMAKLMRQGKAPPGENVTRAVSLLTNTANNWWRYPGFPSDQFAVALEQCAENSGKQREALETIEKLELNEGAEGADVLAALHSHFDTKMEAQACLEACKKAIEADRPNLFRRNLRRYQNIADARDEKLVELACQIRQHGAGFWKKVQTEVIIPMAARLEKHFQAISPPNASSRLALARLGIFEKPEVSVARHDAFLRHHPDEAEVFFVRRNRLHEMKRAGNEGLKQELTDIVAEIPDNPDIIRAIPIELLPVGPKGMTLFEKYLRQLDKIKSRVKANALFRLAHAKWKRGKTSSAWRTVERLVNQYPESPEAGKAKRLAIRVFEKEQLPDGLGQIQAQKTFEWLMGLALTGQKDSFERLTGNVWLFACHPQFREGSKRKADPNPVHLCAARRIHGTWGIDLWKKYCEKFPKDRRGKWMFAYTQVWAHPSGALKSIEEWRKKYPHDRHWLYLHALCLWNIGRQEEALRRFEKLTHNPWHDRWDSASARFYRKVILCGKDPLNISREYELFVKAAGSWALWKELARERDARNGPLRARVEAARYLSSMKDELTVFRQTLGRLKAEMEKERARRVSAQNLVEKDDTKKGVKAEARRVMFAVKQSQKTLERRIAQTKAKLAFREKQIEKFRGRLGLEKAQNPLELPLDFALERLEKQGFSPSLVEELARVIPAENYMDKVRRLLVYVCENSTDDRQVTRTVDRLVKLFPEKRELSRTAHLLTDLALRRPLAKGNMGWLKKSCDLASSAGDVYFFARNNQILSRLVEQDPALNALKTGAVFEEAGHRNSAEYQYLLAVKTAQDAESARRARLKLADFYQKQGRPRKALEILSKLVPLSMPEE